MIYEHIKFLEQQAAHAESESERKYFCDQIARIIIEEREKDREFQWLVIVRLTGVAVVLAGSVVLSILLRNPAPLKWTLRKPCLLGRLLV